ncbi:MAG: hypothetical protein ACXW4B_05630 [Micavibrio sp.]
MDQRTQFLIQVLEKIGGPLTAAVTVLPGQNDGDTAQDAKRVAELLNRSVQLGLSVAEGMNVRDEAQADGVHLALAAFSSPLIAGHYMASGRVPGDLEIRRLSGALQAVLTFADTFTPAADSTMRLQNTEAGMAPADEALIHIQMLTAFAPVFQVVSGYAFGRAENKLIQEIAARLVERAAMLREEIFGDDLPTKTARQIELVLLRVLASLYAAAHAMEMQKLMALGDAARATGSGVSMDPIWAAFDRGAEMARLVAEQIVPPANIGSKSGSGGGLKAVPPSTPPPPRAEDLDNPMAFFSPARKTADGQE